MSIFLLILTLLMLLVIFFDLTSFTIPNWLNAVLLLLYVPFVLTSPEVLNWQMAILGALVVFAVGFGVFVAGWMGGGDIKLLIASAPWLGWGPPLVTYLILLAIIGGALSLALLLIRKVVPWITRVDSDQKLPRILRIGEPVPYGLAIAGAFLMMLWMGDIPGITINL